MIPEPLPTIRSRCCSQADCDRATGEVTSPRLAFLRFFILHEVEKELASLKTPQTHFLGETWPTLDRPRLHVQALVDHAPDGQFLTVA